MPTVASFSVHIGVKADDFTRKLRQMQRELQAFQRTAGRDFTGGLRHSFRELDRNFDRIRDKIRGVDQELGRLRNRDTTLKVKADLDKASLAAVRQQIRQAVVIPVRAQLVGVSGGVAGARRATPGEGVGRRAAYWLADLTDSRLVERLAGGIGLVPAGGGLAAGALGVAGGIAAAPALAAIFGGAKQQHITRMAAIKASNDLAKDFAKNFEIISRAISEAAGKTLASKMETAIVADFLAGAGFNAKQIANLLPTITKAADATGDELQITAEAISGISRTYGISSRKGITWLSDLLVGAGLKSNFDMQSAWYLNKYAAGVARTVGVSLPDLVRWGMTLQDLGTNPESAYRYIGMALSRLAKKGSKLEAMGADIFDEHGRLRPLGEVFDQLRKVTSKMSPKERQKFLADIFGQEGARAISNLLTPEGRKEWKQNSLEGVAGTTAEKAKAATDDLWGDWEKFKGQLEDVRDTLMGKDSPLRGIVQGATKWLEEVEKRLKKGDSLAEILGDALVEAVSKIPYYEIGKVLGENIIDMFKGIKDGVTKVATGFFEGLFEDLGWKGEGAKAAAEFLGGLAGWLAGGAAAAKLLGSFDKLLGRIPSRLAKKAFKVTIQPLIKRGWDRIFGRTRRTPVDPKIKRGWDVDLKTRRRVPVEVDYKKSKKGIDLGKLIPGLRFIGGTWALPISIVVGTVGTFWLLSQIGPQRKDKEFPKDSYGYAKAGGEDPVAALKRYQAEAQKTRKQIQGLGNDTLEWERKMRLANRTANKPVNKKTNLRQVKGDTDSTKSSADRANKSLDKRTYKNTNLKSIAGQARTAKAASDALNRSLDKDITKNVNVIYRTFGSYVDPNTGRRRWGGPSKEHGGGIVKAHSGLIIPGAGTVPTLLWGGEMVLTQPQQAWLFDLLRFRRGVGGGDPMLREAILTLIRVLKERRGDVINNYNFSPTYMGSGPSRRSVFDEFRRMEMLA